MEALVLGATGRFAALVQILGDAGHHVRAATRDPDGPAARSLKGAEVEVVRVDLDQRESIEEAAHLVDAVFAGGTAHRVGPSGDLAHGRNIVDAARAADVPHLV
jgi:uncharacterized protein YbjT (DUF2867 family)